MKLNNLEFNLNDFSSEMSKLKNEKHFDFLVTIIGEDFGDEGLGCIYILENTKSHERASVKALTASREDAFLPTISHLWKAAEMLEREVFDFLGIRSGKILIWIPKRIRLRCLMTQNLTTL